MIPNPDAIADLRRVTDALETAAMNHEMAANSYQHAVKTLSSYAFMVPELFGTVGALMVLAQVETEHAGNLRQLIVNIRRLCDDAEAGEQKSDGEAH